MAVASTDPNTGKPTYNDVSTTQADLQAAADFAEKAMGSSVPTYADLPADGGRIGREIYVEADDLNYTWNGSSWSSAQGGSLVWVPTWTNLTLGNGSMTAQYQMTGKRVVGSMSLLFGSTTSITGLPDFSLPTDYDATLHGLYDALGSASFIDTSAGGTGRYGGSLVILTTKRAFFLYGSNGQVAAGAPFTFASTDRISANFQYWAA